MTHPAYATALETTLTEIKKLCPGVQHSLLFTKEGAKIAGDAETDDKTVDNILDSYRSLVEKADTIGGLKAFHLNGNNGSVTLSIVNDMYLLMVLQKDADTTNLNAATQVILPTVLTLLKQLSAPSPEAMPSLTTPPSAQLTIDILTGFSLFGGDSVEIDDQQLQEWAKLLSQKKIDRVELKAFNGNSTQCKVKEIGDKKQRGKRLIRIPEKICRDLKVKQGEVITVQPFLEPPPSPEQPAPQIYVEYGGTGASYTGY